MTNIVIKDKQPFGKLNFGGADCADMQGANMHFVSDIRGVKILVLSYTFGLRGKWDFGELDKVFLYHANMSKVSYMRGAKMMSFYGATGLNGVLDLVDTAEAYFQDNDLSKVKVIRCNVTTKLDGLKSCKDWQGKIKYVSYRPRQENQH